MLSLYTVLQGKYTYSLLKMQIDRLCSSLGYDICFLVILLKAIRLFFIFHQPMNKRKVYLHIHIHAHNYIPCVHTCFEQKYSLLPTLLKTKKENFLGTLKLKTLCTYTINNNVLVYMYRQYIVLDHVTNK